MAKTGTFQFSVVTPERTVLDCEASFVSFPAHDGEMGALFNRAPLVCMLGIGPLRVESPTGKHELFVDGGFAEVANNRLTVLTQQAADPATIDRASADQALVEARAMKITDEGSYNARVKAVTRAKVQLRMARP